MNSNSASDTIEKDQSTRQDPRKRYEEKFVFRSSVRLTQEELDKINKKRGKHSPVQYMKMAALNKKMTRVQTDGVKEKLRNDILIELHRQGNNLNQLTRFCNSLQGMTHREQEILMEMMHKTLNAYTAFLVKINQP